MAKAMKKSTKPAAKAAGKAKTITIDPITMDVIENALKNARYEMDATLFRTSVSPSPYTLATSRNSISGAPAGRVSVMRARA